VNSLLRLTGEGNVQDIVERVVASRK